MFVQVETRDCVGFGWDTMKASAVTLQEFHELDLSWLECVACHSHALLNTYKTILYTEGVLQFPHI